MLTQGHANLAAPGRILGASAPNLKLLPCVNEVAHDAFRFTMALGARFQGSRDPLIAESRQTAAFRKLTQHPVPVIAVADGGAVVFANTAFAEVLSCSCDAVTSMSYEDICSFLPADETLFAVTPLGADTIGSLLQLGQATLFAKMRRSAITSGADSGVITLFDRLLQRLSQLAEPRVSPL
jgi:hypothetical protein